MESGVASRVMCAGKVGGARQRSSSVLGWAQGVQGEKERTSTGSRSVGGGRYSNRAFHG